MGKKMERSIWRKRKTITPGALSELVMGIE
jgi:hypothetical protein